MMSDPNRRMSWHEDFTRNFSRLFSRSKSLDRNSSEDEASMITCKDQTPEQHLDTTTTQESLLCDVQDRSSESRVQDSTQRGAGGSAIEPPPLCAPASQSGPAAPPVDGFFKRLGSLFLFSQAEPAGVQRPRQADTDGSRPITRDSQTSAETQKTGGCVDPSLSVQLSDQQTLEVSECHSEVTRTQSEALSEDHSNAVDINSAKESLEEKRCFDLACPPVVTYGTYRGLRDAKRQKRKHCMELCSSVSEGEVATRPESQRLGETNISPTIKMTSGSQEHPPAVNSLTHSPSWIQQMDNALTLSPLSTDTESHDCDPAVKCGQTTVNNLPHVDKTNSDQLFIGIGDSFDGIHKPERNKLHMLSNSKHKQSAQSWTLETVSVDPQMSWNLEKTESELKPDEVDFGLHKDVLELESVKMVDNILVNAFSALQRLEESDPENHILLTSDFTKDSGSVLFEGEDRDGNAERQFSVTLDQSPSVVLEDTLAGGRSHAEGCRSTPSSGYESIAGSDTDIRCCVGMTVDACTIETDTSVNQRSQTQSEPFNHSLASNETDSEMKDRPKIVEQLPATQSHNPQSESIEREQICSDSKAKTDVRFLVVDSSLPSEAAVQSDEYVESGGHGSSRWTSVKAFCCNVTNDLSPGSFEENFQTELSLDQAEGTTSAMTLSTKMIQLDFPGCSVPQHSRYHELDLVQVDEGFGIISEEEEIDTVFVNDMGPVHSPSTRRAKAYPFSLSPIYEEESVREDTSRQEMLQVPQATEEEQEYVEQPALSILSLLQSVSEKLQSSMLCGSDEGHVESLRTVFRPPWDHHREDSKREKDMSSILLNQLLTEFKTVNDPNTEDELCSSINQTANETQNGLQEEPNCDGMLDDVRKNASTPLYQYLKSSVKSSTEKEPKDTKHCSAVCHSKINKAITLCIYEGQSLSGERREIFGDVEDAQTVLFSHRVTVHALKGCWLLHADSSYRGPCVLLEEGQTVWTSGDARQNLNEFTEPDRTDVTDIQSVGSIRALLRDDSVPEIHIHPSMSHMRDTVRLFSARDLTEQHGLVLQQDLCVKTGCWLVYDKPGFSGNSAVLETEGRVTPLLQNSLLSHVKSLRPLKMGGLKVMRSLDPKVILYEKLNFQGKKKELLDHAPSLMVTEGLVSISSIRVMGGIWVCFSRQGFRGHQCVLEEGQYSKCTALFSQTQSTIKSLRYIQSDFLEPTVCLKSCDQEISVVDVDVPDLKLYGPAGEADSIHVMSGVWVAYSEQGFTGEQYVLEKGRHPGALEWGSGQSSPRSLRPIRREVCGIAEPKFLLRAYTQPHYTGEVTEFVDEVLDCSSPGMASFRVIRGSWLLFDEKGYFGNQYVLVEGLYPDLTSFGCVSTAVRSLKPISYTFTDPSVSLFSLSSFEGPEVTLYSDVENMDQFFSQSLRVNSGLWVAYEYNHFNGRQMLLPPGEYSDWGKHCNWDTIGSLKFLRQPKVQIKLRNRGLGSVLTIESDPEDSFPAKVFLSSADCLLKTQCWIFADGLLKNPLRRGCLSVIGAKACVGARVALWEEHGRMNQRWTFNEDGTISSHLNRSLVLDLKGESDREHLILSQLCANKVTQTWDMDVL
ncbi:beta/gamma crystallin domain-containing protein 3 isoform X2 [Paramisgurnus dabryanus]|uniref:beta/gamma crystallin domain-containing protein 3 isoform X2 n=1 Tax=Paramisgurnus dabryanus TaxID=90735 RepID=UPI0031F355B4